jgi:hypothetical protein
MILFKSMASVTISSVITVAMLIAFGTGRQPFAAAWSILKSIVIIPKYLFFFIAVLTIMVLNTNEIKI